MSRYRVKGHMMELRAQTSLIAGVALFNSDSVALAQLTPELSAQSDCGGARVEF